MQEAVAVNVESARVETAASNVETGDLGTMFRRQPAGVHLPVLPMAPTPRGFGSSTYAAFEQSFYFRLTACSEEDQAAWRLRYQVYCEETGFLPKLQNPGGFECDSFDVHSRQSLLIHRDSGRVAGTVRVILPRPEEDGCGLVARQTSRELDELPEALLPKANTAEISRFAIDSAFRKRLGDGLYAEQYGAVHALDPRRAVPQMMLGLMVSIAEIVIQTNMSHVCAIIDPPLLRLLSRLGAHFEPAGPIIDFHGPRQPVHASVSDLLHGMMAKSPEIFPALFDGPRCAPVRVFQR